MSVVAGGNRPYFKCSVLQLKDLFEANRSDSVTLAALAQELELRSTDQARKLHARVIKAIEGVQSLEKTVVGLKTHTAELIGVPASPKLPPKSPSRFLISAKALIKEPFTSAPENLAEAVLVGPIETISDEPRPNEAISSAEVIEAVPAKQTENTQAQPVEAPIEVPANLSPPKPEQIIPTEAASAAPVQAAPAKQTENAQTQPVGAPIEAPVNLSPPKPEQAILQVNSWPKPPLPATIDIKELPSTPLPQVTNDPRAILAAWTALEALSPQTYRHPEDLVAGERRNVVNLVPILLPWAQNVPARPNHALYYQIPLGAIPMRKATEALVKTFGSDEELNARLHEKAVIAVVLVDENGIPVHKNAVGISSFAWALPLALQRKLNSLGAWPSVEKNLCQTLNGIVCRFDKNNKPLPLDFETIDTAYRWLVKQFGLLNDLVEAPTFALRIHHHIKAKEAPEPLLLNSFVMGDMARASALIAAKNAPAGLRRYLGIEVPRQTADLLADKAALERAVAPIMMPAARWPSPGGNPLVLLQQAAVNLIRSELAPREGIIAVNGPPGTGKTTLLRDVVAASVVDRALAMSAFNDPDTAFSPSGEKVFVTQNAFFHLYALDPSLKGHEILVAASNNKAAENVSRKLPSLKSIGRSRMEMNYFRSIADNVHNPLDQDVSDNEKTPEPSKSWGLIAAVLGNAKNRAQFVKSFWWHEEYGFRLYLKAAKGDQVIREIKDRKTGQVIEKRSPFVIESEKPPSPQTAKANWRRAREKFLRLRHEVDRELKTLEAVRQTCLRLVDLHRQLAENEAKIKPLLSLRHRVEEPKKQLEAEMQNRLANKEQAERDITNHLSLRPGFFCRLFHTRSWKSWSHKQIALVQAASQAGAALQTAYDRFEKAKLPFDKLIAEIRRQRDVIMTQRQQIALITREVDTHRSTLGNRVIDSNFFAKEREAINLASPWLPDSLHRKREDLFIAALEVHRAFIDASAHKMLHNLSILMGIFSGALLQDEAKNRLLGDLWSTLFMAVPVLSTTFASVEQMLGELPPNSIGWLLIDEAGQALPQSAAGAIMRARRTIVVGDPQQVPPVVTLPERLNTEICNFFKINKPLWAAPEASAQTLADRASLYQSTFRSNQGSRKVGIPLLVHRRCQEPMFGISNRIAYDGQMIAAPYAYSLGKIGAAIGPSTWFDVKGETDTKWCPAEGELVVRLLKQIARTGMTDPDLFIITPFRIIADELRRSLEREKELFSTLKVDITKWAMDRVGTIHTVQGREADSVILVLGAPKPAQSSARIWACSTPNIFNVAVTRAQKNLYVIGSYDAWAEVGCMHEIAQIKRRR